MSEELPQSDSIKIVYVLYLVSLLVGITGLIGLIMAYVNRGNANEIEAAHYRFQIRTFWIGFLYGIIAMITMPIGVGFLMVPLVVIWWIVRCIKGLSAIGRGQAPENVAGWLF